MYDLFPSSLDLDSKEGRVCAVQLPDIDRRNLITVFLGGAPAALPPNFNVGLDFPAEPQSGKFKKSRQH